MSLIKEKQSPKEKNRASYSHRTATTTCPCSVPGLGDSAGADRVRLAPHKDRNISNPAIVIRSG